MNDFVYYTSKGAGDLYIKSKCVFVSKTFVIQDVLKYDGASSDKSNTYTKTDNISLSFDTDHYVAVSSVGSNVGSNFYGLISPNLAFTDDIEIECDIKQTSTVSSIFGIIVMNAMSKSSSDITHYAQVSNYVGTKGITCNPWIDKRSQGSLSTNTWYHFMITITDGTITASIKQGDTTVYSDSISYSYVSSLNNICLSVSQYPNTIHFKNLKIKPL